MKTSRQIEKEKELRKQIVLLAKSELNISIDELHILMSNLGYGGSLRKLNLSVLIYLKNEIQGYEVNPEDELDAQGRYIFFLANKLGWIKKKLYLLIAYKFDKSAIKYLTKSEKGATIDILKRTLNKKESYEFC